MVSEQGWWRRSRWALLSLVVLVPGAVAASLSIDAFEYLETRPSAVTVVEPGGVGQVREGATIRVIDSWAVESGSPAGEEYGVPEGTVLVSVTLEVDATAASDDFLCRVQLLEAERSRRWTSSYGTDYFPGRGLPDDVPSGCRWHDTAYPFEETFLIPADAKDRVVLEVIEPAGLPRALHLRL